MDLKSAYLQIRVAEHWWKYQLVNFEGKAYCLTRLGLGLNCAPMTKILSVIFAKSEKLKQTSPYMDDVLVKLSEVSPEELQTHLQLNRFITKPPVRLEGGSVVGLKLTVNQYGVFNIARGNVVPEVPPNCSRRELFSVCGKLVGPYPVAGWLRVACSYIKRHAEGLNGRITFAIFHIR